MRYYTESPKKGLTEPLPAELLCKSEQTGEKHDLKVHT